LDAYQEDLIGLADLRSRAPELRRRQATIEKELEGVALQALEKTRLTQLNASMENFLAALQQSAKTLEIVERQKIVRLVVKQIIVNGDTLTIHHSIPISRRSQESQPSASYLLCTRSHHPSLGRSLCPVAQLPCFHHSGFQPFIYQFPHHSVSHPLAHYFPEFRMIQSVKVTPDVHI
jgi:site-specific DNA recombinase